jgi:hypothetical protein
MLRVLLGARLDRTWLTLAGSHCAASEPQKQGASPFAEVHITAACRGRPQCRGLLLRNVDGEVDALHLGLRQPRAARAILTPRAAHANIQ